MRHIGCCAQSTRVLRLGSRLCLGSQETGTLAGSIPLAPADAAEWGDSPAIQRETTHPASSCAVWSIAGRHVRPCKRRRQAYLHGDVRRGRSFARGWPAKSCLQQPGPWCVMRMIVRGPPRPCQGCPAKIALRRLVRIQALIASLGCFEASVPSPNGTATAGQRMIFISRIVTCHQRAACMRPWRQRQGAGSSWRIRIQ